jgi:hypothetical protein
MGLFPMAAAIATSACLSVMPATAISLISGIVIFPSGRTTWVGTDNSASCQTFTVSVSPAPIR